MVFLNPSILLGLLAASIPILIHILNFRKLKKVEFSTLAFLKELQKSKIKKIKIKQWLLLLLRTLIIIFLVLAFARPALEGTYFGGTSSTAKSSVAFVIDNSFSMSLIKNKGSLFNKSKTEAKKIISPMQNGDEFYFITSNDSVSHFTNKNSAINYISQLDISLLTESLSKKIETATKVLTEAQNINKELYLFSDFQKTTFIDSVKINFSESNNIKLYSFDIGEKDISNLSVTNLRIESSIVEINKPITFSTVINNFSQTDIKDVVVSLVLNGKTKARQNVSIKKFGQKEIKFNTSVNTTGIIEAEVHLEEDNIIQDNIAYSIFYIPEKIKILLLYDNIADTKYLNAVFNSSMLTNKFEVTKLNAVKKINVNYSLYDVIFLISTDASLINSIKRTVNTGDNLVIIPPSDIGINDLRLLSNKLKYPLATNIIKTEKSRNDYAEFDYINLDHPIFQNLFDTKKSSGIETPQIFKFIDLNITSNVLPIIKLNNKTTFIGEYKLRKGKVVFFNTALNLNWSNFPLKGIFAPLITKIVFYLATNNMVFNNYIVGEPIPIDVSNISFPQLEVKLPDGNDNISLVNFNGKIYNYTETSQTGNYKFYSNNKLVSFASVNVNQKESDLSKLDNKIKNKFFEKYFGNNFLNIDITTNYIEKIKQARYGTELWKPFLIITLLLALIEMYIARNTKNDLTNLDKK